MAKEPKDKEKEKDTPPSGEEQNPAEGGDLEQTMVALTYDEYDALEEQISQLQKELDDTRDSWLRCRADFDNYKKRVQRDAQRSHQDAMASILKVFLSASDDLERALKNKPAGAGVDGWVDGIELIAQKLNNQMKNQGVERLDVKPGDEFDPNIHEAITQEPNPDFEEGQIIDVIQPGYKIADRIIRPAMVRVAQ